ncbi:unnamed protein product, partial [marine sediment metagenome]
AGWALKTGVRQYNPSGRNKRSVWTIATQPYSEAHFATFPPKLIEPMIKAGTSEKGCCPECGSPWQRIVEKRACPRCADEWSQIDRIGEGGAGGGHNVGIMGGAALAAWRAEHPPTTTGWRPTCECIGEWEIITGDEPDFPGGPRIPWRKRIWHPPDTLPTLSPCVVLDPFLGSGTTGMVASLLGRDWLGIELNPDYAKMAEDRIGSAMAPETYTKADVPDDAPLFTP